MFRTLEFEKDPDFKWYVVLPEWEYDRAQLEMVAGADVMLDVLSQGASNTFISISDEAPIEGGFELLLIKPNMGGGDYIIKNHPNSINFDVWLCEVVKFVFGELPKIIYLK